MIKPCITYWLLVFGSFVLKLGTTHVSVFVDCFYSNKLFLNSGFILIVGVGISQCSYVLGRTSVVIRRQGCPC